MNISEAITKTFARELPEAIVWVEQNHNIKAEIKVRDYRPEMFAIFYELVKQFAGDLKVDFENKLVSKDAIICLSGDILPTL